jgi:hypothetical protein
MTDLIYGPQTPAVQALISRASRLTPDETTRLAAAWATWDAVTAARTAMTAARTAAWNATWNAAMNAMITARDAAWNAEDATGDAAWAAGDATGAAALGLAVRDLIPDDVYRTLTHPWAEAIGPAHPNDPTPETPHA